MGIDAESDTHSFEYRGEIVELELVRRPFREGIEVRFYFNNQLITLPEFGYGLVSIEERVRAEIDRLHDEGG